MFCAKLLQSCSILIDPVDCGPPGSSVRGILQARTGVGSHSLLQEIFLIPGIKPASPEAPALQADSLVLSHQGNSMWCRHSVLLFSTHLINGNSDRLFSWAPKSLHGDCHHEIKRSLPLGRKAMTNQDSVLKRRDITLLTKVHIVKAMVFPGVVY